LAFKHDLHPAGNRRTNTIVDRDSEPQILDWIRQNADSSIAITRQEIRHCYTSQFQTATSQDWENLFVLRSRDEMIQQKSIRKDRQRLQVQQLCLDRSVQDPKEYVQRSITELIFNLDEVGISDWEDRKTRNIVAASTRRGEAIHHGMSRNVKYISAIISISTNEKPFVVYIIALQDFPSIRKQLKKHESEVRYQHLDLQSGSLDSRHLPD
jgi:hypothetical protein